jgi:oxygen-dependent protoporphyrinogen oxidase
LRESTLANNDCQYLLCGKKYIAMETNFDIIVVGAGISGLGAALKLKDAGLNVLVLEKENRVGGRISTDRIQCQDGNPGTTFAIDRGATLFGGRFKHMKALVKRLNLEQYVDKIDFAFELHDGKTKKKIRRTRIDDVLFHPKLPFKAKWALIKFGLSVLLKGRKLGHGNTCAVEELDDMNVDQYFEKLGGKEILEHFLHPGLNGPLGGNLRKNSRVILFQTFWNILLMPTWAMKGGMDRITEGIRKELNVKTGVEVQKVEIVRSSGVESATIRIECTKGEILTAKKVIIALPGHLVPKICDQLPDDVKKLLSETTYGKMANAHVMLNRPTDTTCAAVGIHESVDFGYEIEVENNRAAQLSPEGKGLVSVFMWDEGNRIITDKTDEEVKLRAAEIVRERFPECKDAIMGTHVIRWNPGIAHFAPGRLTQMCKLRKQMREWDLPIQLCGDYLDGIASESALATGEQAAENLLIRL